MEHQEKNNPKKGDKEIEGKVDRDDGDDDKAIRKWGAACFGAKLCFVDWGFCLVDVQHFQLQ